MGNRKGRVMNSYLALGIGALLLSPAQADELDQWSHKINKVCILNPETTSGREMPAIVEAVGKKDFRLAELLAKGIKEEKDRRTDTENLCAETVLAALSTLKATAQATPEQDG